MSSTLLKTLHFKWPSKTVYHSVPLNEKINLGEDDILLHDPQTRKHRIYTAVRHLLLPLTTLALFIALCTILTLHLQLLRETAPLPRLHCGDSIATAKSRGCTFDQLNKAWMPQECPRYGLEEYLKVGFDSGSSNTTDRQFPYYTDKLKTQEVTIEQLSHMAAPFEVGEKWWTSGREHMTHCTWMLIRLAYAYSKGLRTDMLVSNFHHAKHCALFMLDRGLEGEGYDDIRIEGNTVFGSC